VEGYLQAHRRRALERARAEYLEVEKYIAASDRHKRYEKKYPGQMAQLMQDADKELQRAEWMLPALLKEATQKIAFDGFNSTLRAAHGYMLQAYLHPSVMLGQETSGDRAKGAFTVNSKRTNELAPLLELLAKRRDGIGDYLQPSELWPALEMQLDNLTLHPHQVGTGKVKQYDFDNKGSITYENFRKSIRRIRNKWDNA